MVKRAAGALLLSIAIDANAARPVSIQLYTALRDLILAGGFAVGERLPASRTLARELGLSRTTVMDAFDRLTAEGMIESRIGSGAYVSRALDAERPRAPGTRSTSGTLATTSTASTTCRTGAAGDGSAASSMQAPARLSRAMARAVSGFAERRLLPSAARAFTTALPAFDGFPMSQWARLTAKHWRSARHEVMGYGEPLGYPALRRSIALHLRANRGIGCDADQIFIVGGAQQAFHLIGLALLDPGDKVWFENPGAIGARNSLIAAGAELVPVPVDEHGLCVAEGLRLSPRFGLAFVTPSHQQPLGTVMSLERRFALLHAAERAGAWIVEDDYDGEFSFGGPPLPTLKSVDSTGLVIHVGTFSKSLFPSLRLGYMLVPPALVDPFATIMTRLLNGVPTSTQAVVSEFIDEGHFAVHLRRMRRIYAERHEALCDAARARLAGALDVVPSRSGLHTIGWLRGGWPERHVAAAADARGITVSPIERFAMAPIEGRGLVLGFGGVTPPQIDLGVQVLAEVLERQPRAA